MKTILGASNGVCGTRAEPIGGRICHTPAKRLCVTSLLSAVSLSALLLSMPAARAYVINNATETVPGTHSSPRDLAGANLEVGTSEVERSPSRPGARSQAQ